MPGPAFNLESIPAVLATALEQAQKSAATHRKNVAILHKLFLNAATVVEKQTSASTTSGLKKTRTVLTGEIAFIEALKLGINRILVVKKGIVQADRCVKFICSFISYATEHAAAEGNEENSAISAAASRLVSHVLKHLLKGFQAKDKNVRFRSAQFGATMITGLGELDDADYQALKGALILRVKDKEAAVRVQATVALSKLQGADDLNDVEDVDASDDEDEENVTKILVQTMRHDPSAEVRRAALFQLDLTPQTLPYILSRTRDVDPMNRKLMYTSALTALPGPNVLSQDQRVDIVKKGLKDREESVRTACKKLVGKWAGDVDGGILSMLSLFDVISNTEVASSMLDAVFDTRQDLAAQLQFPEAFWIDLTPESALLVRGFIAYCKAVNDELRLEEALPVVTALAYRIQDHYDHLMGLAGMVAALPPLPSTSDVDSEDEDEEAHGAQRPEADQALLNDFEADAFVLNQLLEIAMMHDYSDELGRRKMFTLIRDMISNPDLPSILIPACMDVLLRLSTNERDFMRVIVEIVQNVREEASNAVDLDQDAVVEEDEDDEIMLDLDTATPEEIAEDQRRRRERLAKKMQAKAVENVEKGGETNFRCLALVKALLERVAGSLQDNATLLGLVHELIVPSVRSKEPQIREQGLICLGLCCLLDKNMALESFGLFVHQSQNTEGELQIRIFEIIFDILMLYGVNFLESKGHNSERVLEFLLHSLNLDNLKIQAIATVGISKLMLSGMVCDDEVLKRLVLVYFAPETIDNLELRQCLSYFFPVYCYSLSANQKRMREIFISSFEILSSVYEELEDPSMMVSPLQLANQLLDWTDPQKAVATEGVAVDEEIQVELAIELLKEIYKETKKDTRKLLCQLLNKLYIPNDVDEWKLKNLLLLISQLGLHRPLSDTVSKNALAKFETGLKKRFADKAANLDEEDFRKLEELMTSVTFLDAIVKENEEMSDIGELDEDDREIVTAGRQKTKKKTPGASRRGRRGSKTTSRASKTPSVEPEEEVPTRRPIRKAALAPPKKQVIPEDSEEEDSPDLEDDDDDESEDDAHRPGQEEEDVETDDSL